MANGLLDQLGLPEQQTVAPPVQDISGGGPAGTFFNIGSRLGSKAAPAVAGAISGIQGKGFAAGAEQFTLEKEAAALGLTVDQLTERKKKQVLRKKVSAIQPDKSINDSLEREIDYLNQVVATTNASGGDIEVTGQALRRIGELKSEAAELKKLGIETEIEEKKRDAFVTGGAVELVRPNGTLFGGGFERKSDGQLFFDSAHTDPVPDGWFATSITVQATDLGGLSLSKRDQSKLDREQVELAEASSDLRENLSHTMRNAIELPGTVGIKGFVGEKVGGAASALLGQEAGDAISVAITGADQEAQGAMRAQMSNLRSKLKPIATGDSSARTSETERQIAGRLVGLIEELDVSASYPQVMGGLRELYSEGWVTEFNAAARSDLVDFPLDLNNNSGIESLARAAFAAGLDDEDVEDLIQRLTRIQIGVIQ